jgi:tRNA modification GTPase
MNKYPTIVAIATPLMKCAIHVIRISGSDCYEIVNKVTSKKIKKNGYTIQHVNIYDHDKVVDDVLVLKYVAPKSYTGEDMVEITCHGSPFIASKIVELLVINGAKVAGPGEFTKRAFLNNKLNLLQAEGINNLINSNSNASLKIAHKSIDKKTSEKISGIVSSLFLIIGQVEVNIDYPEYDDVPQISNNEIKARLTKIIKSLNNIVDDSNKVIPYVNGINVAIVGKPNVGKSSLLNAILNENKAIVSSIPGTTRDIIQYSVIIGDIAYNFIDTAGIHTPTDRIEKAGIKLSKNTIKNAQLILFVVDGSKKSSKEDQQIYKLIKNKNHIVVINKSDIKQLKTDFVGIKVSAKTKDISNLINKINKSAMNYDADLDVVLPSKNDINLTKSVISILDDVLVKLNNNEPLDLLIEDLKLAHNKLLAILGQNDDFDLVNELFKNFCVGK